MTLYDGNLRRALDLYGPHRRRWMMFVDGENLAIRGKEVLADLLAPGNLYVPDVFLWRPNGAPQIAFPELVNQNDYAPRAIRCHYYTSAKGDEGRLEDLRAQFRAAGSEPEVFKRRDGKSKGVDIALARDFLGHAYKDNYDSAVLVAGDGDYVPLVEDVKRLGKTVAIAFFAGPFVNRRLMVEADSFLDLTNHFRSVWAAAKPKSPSPEV